MQTFREYFHHPTIRILDVPNDETLILCAVAPPACLIVVRVSYPFTNLGIDSARHEVLCGFTFNSPIYGGFQWKQRSLA